MDPLTKTEAVARGGNGNRGSGGENIETAEPVAEKIGSNGGGGSGRNQGSGRGSGNSGNGASRQ